jgi:PAS domain S-box-containing protein
VGVSADYGAREKAGMELRDSHHEAELFINAVPSILIGLDSQGRIKRWNGAAAQAFGLEGAEVLGKALASCEIRWLNPDIESRIGDLLWSEQRLSLDDIRFEKAGEPRLLGMRVNWIRLPTAGGASC